MENNRYVSLVKKIRNFNEDCVVTYQKTERLYFPFIIGFYNLSLQSSFYSSFIIERVYDMSSEKFIVRTPTDSRFINLKYKLNFDDIISFYRIKNNILDLLASDDQENIILGCGLLATQINKYHENDKN